MDKNKVRDEIRDRIYDSFMKYEDLGKVDRYTCSRCKGEVVNTKEMKYSAEANLIGLFMTQSLNPLFTDIPEAMIFCHKCEKSHMEWLNNGVN